MKHKVLRKVTSVVAVAALILMGGVPVTRVATAAGINDTSLSDNIIDSTGGAQQTSLDWTASSAYGDGDTITISAQTGLDALNCGTAFGPTYDVDGDTVADSCVDNGDTLTITLAAGAHSTALSVPIEVSETTVGGYYLNFSQSDTSDFGVALLWSETPANNDANEVNVTANVNTTLSLQIVTDATGTDTGVNVCDMGTIETTNYGNCSYFLKVGTNYPTGAYVTAETEGGDGLEANGGANDIDVESSTAAGAGNNDNAVDIGTEEYGFGYNSGASVVEVGAFATIGSYDNSGTDTNVEDVPTATTSILSTNGAPMDAGYIEVDHSATINGATAAGAYSQKMLYSAQTSL